MGHWNAKISSELAKGTYEVVHLGYGKSIWILELSKNTLFLKNESRFPRSLCKVEAILDRLQSILGDPYTEVHDFIGMVRWSCIVCAPIGAQIF